MCDVPLLSLCCRVEEEESLKAVLEMSKKEAVQGAVQGTPPTDNGNEDGLLGLNFGTSSEIDGLGGGWSEGEAEGCNHYS